MCRKGLLTIGTDYFLMNITRTHKNTQGQYALSRWFQPKIKHMSNSHNLVVHIRQQDLQLIFNKEYFLEIFYHKITFITN